MSSTTTTTTVSSTVTQYGFYFDQSRCWNCHTCTTACMEWNNLPPGPVRLSRIYDWEEGSFPNVRQHFLFAACYHCQNPACIPQANGAMFKEPKYGAVLIDPQQATSTNLKAAWDACPYGSIQFDSDSPDSTAYKCTMCIDRLEQGLLPICVASCPARALDFDTIDNLTAKYGSNQQLEGMPDPSTTNPSVRFTAQLPKTQLVPYDVGTALTLLAQRSPYTPVFTSSTDETEVPPGLVKKTQLVMKASSVEEEMQYTTCDEG